MYAAYKKLNLNSEPDVQNFVQNADIKELIEMVAANVCRAEGEEMLDKILQGFGNHEKHYPLIEAVLQRLLKSKVTIHHVDKIINRIISEFTHYERKPLLKLVNFCLLRIENNDDDFMSWKDMLPFLLQSLREEKFINYNGIELSGVEYKSEIVKKISHGKWDLTLGTPIAKMFREMSLEKNDLEIAMKSLCHIIPKVELNEIPPLIHQLLRLGNDSRLLLNTLQRYYYEKYAEASQESSNITDINVCVKDIQVSEGTVLYHIFQAVQMDHKILKDYLKFLRTVINKPDFIFNSFTVSVLLYNVNIFKDLVFEVLKLTIARKHHEDEKRKNSIWLTKLEKNHWRVIDVFDEVIKNCDKYRLKVVENLLNFAFYLMGTAKTFSHDEVFMWETGEKIVQKIAKRVPDSGPTILQNLSEKIITNEFSFLQYTDCLSYMCRKLTLVILDNQTPIVYLLEQLLSKSESDATPVISAVLPLLKLSHRIRDTFVLVLRKALTKNSIHLRKMAILGFLELLKNLKVSSLNALSQGNCSSSASTSSSSIIVQATLETRYPKISQDPRHNISICQELLSILGRCFMYDCQVRLYFYKSVYNVVAVNMELAEYVTQMLLDHLMIFYDPDEDILPPIIFDKCTVTQGAEEVVVEPLGDLFFLVQKLYIKTVLKNYVALGKFATILESVTKRISQTEAEHLNINETTDLLDNTPKSMKIVHNLKLTISVCEALIAYRFGCWSTDSINFAHIVSNLFKAYIRFTDLLKRSSKVKKGDPKKADKDVTDKNMTRKNNRAVTLKPPNTIMDIYTVNRMLLLLFETNLSWVSEEEADILRRRLEFINYVLQTCLQLIRDVKLLKGDSLKKHKDQNAKTYIQIGGLLFKNVIKKVSEDEDLHPITVSYAVECFKELSHLMCNSWTSELPLFLKAAGDVDEGEGLNSQINIVVTALESKFTAILQEKEEDDVTSKKVALQFIETISYFVHNISFGNNGTSRNIRGWLKILGANKIEDPAICLIIIQLMLFVDAKTSEHGEILRKICEDLFDKSSKSDSATGDYEIINENTFLQIYCAVNNAIKSKLSEVSTLFNRLKAEQVVVSSPGMKNNDDRGTIRMKERELCNQLSNITGLLDSLVKCRNDTGTHTTAVFKNIQQIFNILSNFTKYFISKSNSKPQAFETTRFGTLVEHAGTDLKPHVEELIYYIEENKKKQSKNNDAKNKILKDIKIIPKVTFEIEQFTKEILTLSKKSGVDLTKVVKHSTTRDFRVDKILLEEHLERVDVTTQNTTHRSNRTDREDTINDRTRDSDSESEATPRKRRKSNSSDEF